MICYLLTMSLQAKLDLFVKLLPFGVLLLRGCEGSPFVSAKVAWRVGRPNWQCCSLSFERAHCGLLVAQAHSVYVSPCSTQLSHWKLHFVVNICYVIE